MSLARVLALLLLVACRSLPVPAQPADTDGARDTRQAATPSLVVLLSVDQMRGDYLDRFAAQYTGGFARLRQGAWFAQAMQDHGITETAPGHATLLSGRYPVHTGIASNFDGVADGRETVLASAEPGASPTRFRGTTLADWMLAADKRTRILSVSRKDRAAILPVGRGRGDVYWYAANGMFTQSTWYGRKLPDWVTRFNAKRYAASYAGWTWTPLLDERAYPEPDSVPAENRGRRFQFPYAIQDDPDEAPAVLPAFPVMDELTLRFALAGVEARELGAAVDRTDLLAISLSSTDAVGHRFGPDSRELHDQLLRLDRYLGDFLDRLFTLRDSSRVVIVLTSDHGVTPFPSVHSTVTPNPGATYVDVMTPWRTVVRDLSARGVDTMQVDFDGTTMLVGDTSSFVRRRVSVDSVTRAFAATLRATAGVARADLPADLARADTATDVVARRWLHSFAPGGMVRLVVTLDRFNYRDGEYQASHNGPWDLDAWVPLIFWGAPFRHERITRPVRTVDLAPTLAHLLNVRMLERVDGVVLRDALR